MTRPAAIALLLAAAPALAQFKGESCTHCHRWVRDAEPSASEPALPEPRREVVVIGGGLSGLSAAHFLRDRDVLVLEKEEKAGGHAKRDAFANGKYPVAAVYIVDPYGPIKTLYDDLKIEPLRIEDPAETLHFRGEYIPRWLSAGSSKFPKDVRGEMKKLVKAIQRLGHREITIPASDTDPEILAELEGITFDAWLRKEFGPTAAKLGDMFAKDMFGAGAKDISAYMGVLYIIDEFVPGYSFEGGLGAISEALAGELGDKVRTGATVVETRQLPDGRGVAVRYRSGGQLREVQADAAIFSTHLMVTRKLAKDLSEAKRAAIGKVRYSSYVTVPLSFSEVVWDKSFTLWSADAFFTDITFPSKNNSRWPGTDKHVGQVGVVYAPLGTDEGRSFLEQTTDAEIVEKVKTDLEKILPGSTAKIVEARVIRWGHAMPAMGPNYFRDLQPELARPEGRYFFAGEDTQAAAIEGAVFSGYFAAEGARKVLPLRDGEGEAERRPVAP